jgi:hypothetical protein
MVFQYCPEPIALNTLTKVYRGIFYIVVDVKLLFFVRVSTGLLKKKYTLSIIYFTKTTDAKSLCTDGKEISQSSDLNLPLGAHAMILYAKGSYVELGKSWIIDLTSFALHVGLTSSL